MSSSSFNVKFSGPTERNITVTQNIDKDLSKSKGGSIKLGISEDFDKYEWFVGGSKEAEGKNVTLQAANPAFALGYNWITIVVYSGTGANAVPWSGEFTVVVSY